MTPFFIFFALLGAALLTPSTVETDEAEDDDAGSDEELLLSDGGMSDPDDGLEDPDEELSEDEIEEFHDDLIEDPEEPVVAGDEEDEDFGDDLIEDTDDPIIDEPDVPAIVPLRSDEYMATLLLETAIDGRFDDFEVHVDTVMNEPDPDDLDAFLPDYDSVADEYIYVNVDTDDDNSYQIDVDPAVHGDVDWLAYHVTLGDDVTDFYMLESSGSVVIGAGTGQTLRAGDAAISILFGGAGDDTFDGTPMGPSTFVGGDGDDIMQAFANQHADMYGGNGDDIITSNVFLPVNDPFYTTTIASGGAGDDFIAVNSEMAYVSLGVGEDLGIFASNSNSSVAEASDNFSVITDFDPADDRIVLLVTTPQDIEITELTYVLTEIETDSGIATLVSPAYSDDIAFDGMNETGASHAILLGLTPDQVSDDDITVLLVNSSDANGIQMGQTLV